jgi:hypothetical protein
MTCAAGESLQYLEVQGEGVQKIQEGLAEIQSAVQQTRAQFVDTAGNIYDAVMDTAGRATNMVRDAVGNVFDVTNMAGQWLLAGVAQYPDQARQAAQETAESLRATASDFRQFAGEISEAARKAIPEIPSRGQLTDRNAWISKIAINRMYADRFYDTVTEQFELLADGLEARYCEPAKLLPSYKKTRGELQFPGGLKLSLYTTECEILKTSHRNGTEIACRAPRLEFEKLPARYRSKHHTPVKFKSKLCKFEVSHGDEDEIVLAVFDGKNEVDMKSVMSAVDRAMVGAYAEDSGDAGVEEFYRLLPEIADVKADAFEMVLGAMPDEASIAQMAGRFT